MDMNLQLISQSILLNLLELMIKPIIEHTIAHAYTFESTPFVFPSNMCQNIQLETPPP